MLTIRPLGPADAADLSAMLRAQRPEYLRYFTPFRFDEATLSGLLEARVHDVYLGLYWAEDLAALCMVRGWDEGYEIPAFGVIVAERYQGNGLGAVALEVARAIGRLRRSPRLMLKVHPDNLIARRLYARRGFRESGADARTGNIIMVHDLCHPD